MHRGPVKEGVRAVRVDMDLDPRLDEMRANQAFRDLQLERPVGDAIVIADLPLLLDAQDLIEVDAGNGREGQALACRLNGEAGVVGGQIHLADEGVGRIDIGYACKCQFLDETILRRSERALRTAPGLGRSEERPSLDGLWGEEAPIRSRLNCAARG